MEKNHSLTFLCPNCDKNFEFDLIEEYEIVQCPICKTVFMSIKTDGFLHLKEFDFEKNVKTEGIMIEG